MFAMAEVASYSSALFVSVIVLISSSENIWPYIAEHFWPREGDNGVPIPRAISPLLYVRFVIRCLRVFHIAVIIALKHFESSPKARMTITNFVILEEAIFEVRRSRSSGHSH
jgi:hypothetical protein